MAEEKELTIEEMKTLISVTKILPILLDKISELEKKINDFSSSFGEIKEKVLNNAKLITSFENSVNEFNKTQIDSNTISEELSQIKEALLRIETSSTKPLNTSVVDNTPKAEPAPKKVDKKSKEDEKVDKVIDALLTEKRANKNHRPLRKDDIVKGMGYSVAVADKVLTKLEKMGLYNPKLNVMTFPKSK